MVHSANPLSKPTLGPMEVGCIRRSLKNRLRLGLQASDLLGDHLELRMNDGCDDLIGLRDLPSGIDQVVNRCKSADRIGRGSLRHNRV